MRLSSPMRYFLTAMFLAAAVLLQPVVDQAFAGFAARPNLQLAPLAICVSLCPGAPAVICCGLLGLIFDCLAGPQLGARVACFSLLAALGSIALGRTEDSWLRRVAAWAAILFAAEMLLRIIAVSSLGGTFRPAAAALEAALSAMATTTLLSCLWLAGQFLSRGPRSARSLRPFAPAVGRAAGGD
jgi:cell shape-determining protein MreD